MAQTTKNKNPLDAAQERLESALAALTEEARKLHTDYKKSEDDLRLARSDSEASEKMATALQRTEMENLRLHEKIATLSIAESKGEAKSAKESESLKKELENAEQNYAQLKKRFGELKKELEEKERELATHSIDMKNLRRENDELRKDRTAIRSRLDAAIAKVEQLVEGG